MSTIERKKIAGTFAYATNHNQLHADHVHLALIGEGDHKTAMDFLQKKSQTIDTYIGFGGAINLSYILTTKPKTIRLCDINPFQKFFWDRVYTSISKLKNKDDFVHFLIKSEKELPHLLKQKFAQHPFSKHNGLSCHFDSIHKNNLPWESSKGPYRSLSSVEAWLKQTNSADLLWFNNYAELRNIIINADYKSEVIDIYDDTAILNLNLELQTQSPDFVGIYISSIPRFSDWAGRNINTLKRRLANNLETLEAIAPNSITIDDCTLVHKQHKKNKNTLFSFERKKHVIA